MAVLVWSALASLTAITTEYLFRKGVGWETHLWLFIPLAIAINFFIYKLVTTSDTWVLAFLLFALTNIAARGVASHFLLNESALDRGNLIALVALVAAVGARYNWK